MMTMKSTHFRPIHLDQVSAESATDEARAARYLRRTLFINRVLAVLLLVPCLPIIGLLLLIVRWTSPGPALFRQRRVGLAGRTFNLYKIRTMRLDAEARTGPVWATENDPRVTPVGRILRKLHLDELPQLFNVLQGEMSLIGPRPERPEFTEKLADEIPSYLARLTVRPGITGLAQVNLPPDSDLDSVQNKLTLDLQYIDEANPKLDLQILLATALRLVGIKGPRATRWLGFECAGPTQTPVSATAGDSDEVSLSPSGRAAVRKMLFPRLVSST